MSDRHYYQPKCPPTVFVMEIEPSFGRLLINSTIGKTIKLREQKRSASEPGKYKHIGKKFEKFAGRGAFGDDAILNK